jgi:hypothetical protein
MRRLSTSLTLAAALAVASCAARQAPSRRVVENRDASGGLVSRATMQNGRRHGLFEMFYPDGRPAIRGVYANGMRHGVFSFWSEDGSLRRRLLYRRDRVFWDSASGTPAPPLASVAPIPAALPPRVPVRVGFDLYGLAGSNRTAERIDSPARPLAIAGAGAAIVVRGSILWAGAGLDYTASDTQLYHTYYGVLVGVQLEAPGLPALHLDAAIELGGHRVGGIGEGRVFAATPRSRWVPYYGLRAGTSYRLTDRLSLFARLATRRDLARDTFTIVEPQNPVGPIGDELQIWEVGGRAAFGSLGLRLDVR